MEYFTTRNNVILALVQTAVIVFGVLGAGAAYRWYANLSIAPPISINLFADYGMLMMVLPLAWITATLSIEWSDTPDFYRIIAFWSGVLLLLLLLLGVWYAVAKPFLRLAGSGCCFS
jgi:hypothetical protein